MRLSGLSKKLAIALAVLILLCLSPLAIFPKVWQVERNGLIRADRSVIFAHVEDLRLWRKWSIWSERVDPTLQVQFSGAPNGSGAIYRFAGQALGSGVIAITHAEIPSLIFYLLSLYEGRFQYDGAVLLDQESGGTRVTWVLSGDEGYNPLARLLAWWYRDVIGDNIEDNIIRLKLACEKDANQGQLPVPINP